MIFAAPVQRARLGNVAGCDAYLLSTTPLDPLAAFTWAARLQTHNGDNVPLGLYQDVACTIPATEDGHSIAAWRDELSLSGIVLIQADPQKQPMLIFVDGVPTVFPDGVDDEMSCTAFVLTSAVLFVCAEATSAEASIVITKNNDGRWNDAGQGHYGVFRDVRITSYPAVVPTSLYHVYTINSAASYLVNIDSVSKGVQAGDFNSGTQFFLFRPSGGVYYDGPAIAVLLIPTLTDPQITTAEAYLATLNP